MLETAIFQEYLLGAEFRKLETWRPKNLGNVQVANEIGVPK